MNVFPINYDYKVTAKKCDRLMAASFDFMKYVIQSVAAEMTLSIFEENLILLL